MGLLKAVLVVLCIINTVICEDSFLHACAKSDITCLSQSTEKFLEKTHNGIKDMDIRPIDPMIIKDIIYEADKNIDLWYHFKNITVTGLKSQRISDFKMDTDRKSVVLKTKADLHIESDIIIQLRKQSKSFYGTYTADTSVIGSASYNYDLKTNSQGVRYFEVGPETITCEAIEKPKVMLDEGLKQAMSNDKEAQEKSQQIQATTAQIQNDSICAIVKLAYVDVIHNIRASAKILPASAFFKDI